MDMHKRDNGENIQAMGTSHYFIVRQVVLLGVSDHCVKKTNICSVPMNIDISKSYGMDSISCTEFVRVMGYKYLLLAAHTFTYLLVCRHRVEGGGGDDNDCHHHGLNANQGGEGGGVK